MLRARRGRLAAKLTEVSHGWSATAAMRRLSAPTARVGADGKRRERLRWVKRTAGAPNGTTRSGG